MKRHLASLLAMGLMAAVALTAEPPKAVTPQAFPPLTLAKSTECGECVPCQKGCNIDVYLRPDGKRCVTKGLTEQHKIWHIKPNQTATFVFHNDCASAVDAGVGHFGPHPKKTCTVSTDHPKHEAEWKQEKKDKADHYAEVKPGAGRSVALSKDPFVAGKRSVHVAAGQTQSLPLTLIPNARAPRTYKYAIMVNGKPKLDPEIEIERQN